MRSSDHTSEDTSSYRKFTSLASGLSVLDAVSLGSSFSIRTMVRLGSAVSIYGQTRLGSSCSLLDSVIFGFSSSIRSFVRCGSALSVYGFSKVGSLMSVLDFCNVGSSVSTRSFSRLGSALSLYGFTNFGCGCSVLDWFHVGSSLSVRTCVRMGSAMSTYGISQFGSSVSVLDFFTVGSSFSLRTCARLGSALSSYGVLGREGADLTEIVGRLTENFFVETKFSHTFAQHLCPASWLQSALFSREKEEQLKSRDKACDFFPRCGATGLRLVGAGFCPFGVGHVFTEFHARGLGAVLVRSRPVWVVCFSVGYDDVREYFFVEEFCAFRVRLLCVWDLHVRLLHVGTGFFSYWFQSVAAVIRPLWECFLVVWRYPFGE